MNAQAINDFLNHGSAGASLAISVEAEGRSFSGSDYWGNLEQEARFSPLYASELGYEADPLLDAEINDIINAVLA